MTTVSVENYLKAIYHMEAQGIRATTKAIAEALQVSQPSVTSMLQTLAAEDFVTYQPYKGAHLRERGTLAALRVIRKHRLIEMFLVETLGYTWDEVHAEAENLEHAVSDILAERIDAFLDNPRFDPHGDPIPTADGEVHHRELIPLHETPPGLTVRLARVLDQNPDVLRHLAKIGLIPEAHVTVVDVLPFDGQMTLRIGADETPVSRSLASRLLVSEI
ncbi:MAG: metal-dependent transcriptional regulator [bacterium]